MIFCCSNSAGDRWFQSCSMVTMTPFPETDTILNQCFDNVRARSDWWCNYMIMVLRLCPTFAWYIPSSAAIPSWGILKVSVSWLWRYAKVCEAWALTPAMCDWKIESQCFPERIQSGFWEFRLNLNKSGLSQSREPQMLTNFDYILYLCHYVPISDWSIHDVQTRRPSRGLSDGIPVCVWNLWTQPVQKRHEETGRNTITGRWFGTCFIFPYIGNHHPNWLS